MKRFILFAGYTYYPCGGADDMRGSFDTLLEATTQAATTHCDWWHVLDTQTGEVAAKHSQA